MSLVDCFSDLIDIYSLMERSLPKESNALYGFFAISRKTSYDNMVTKILL